MTMQKIKEHCKLIEEMTGRTVVLRGTTINNKPGVCIDINGMFYRCVLFSELYWCLSGVYWLIHSLKYGKNPVQF